MALSSFGIADYPTNDILYPMRVIALIFGLFAGLMASPACAKSADSDVVKTTVCDIVNHPSQFTGKTVEIRAQVWPDSGSPDLQWMNESSVQSGKVCAFLEASFMPGSGLGGQQAFGTFRGRIVKKLSRQKSSMLTPDSSGPPVIFLVDQQSDIYMKRDYLNGPIPMLQLYDPQTATFVRPAH